MSSSGTPFSSLGTSHSPDGPASVRMYGFVYPPEFQADCTPQAAPYELTAIRSRSGVYCW